MPVVLWGYEPSCEPVTNRCWVHQPSCLAQSTPFPSFQGRGVAETCHAPPESSSKMMGYSINWWFVVWIRLENPLARISKQDWPKLSTNVNGHHIWISLINSSTSPNCLGLPSTISQRHGDPAKAAAPAYRNNHQLFDDDEELLMKAPLAPRYRAKRHSCWGLPSMSRSKEFFVLG